MIPKLSRSFPALRYGVTAAQYRLTLIPFFLEGVAARSTLNQADGIHPTAQGYQVIVDYLWPKIEPLLKNRQSSIRGCKTENRLVKAILFCYSSNMKKTKRKILATMATQHLDLALDRTSAKEEWESEKFLFLIEGNTSKKRRNLWNW